jgi:UDP-2-acetamido-3-amino-2,3-dideoxy-glucuronate N-acetyltransferase
MNISDIEIKVSGVKLIPIVKNTDPRGNLLAFEAKQKLPFEVKRIFMVNSVPKNQVRGTHAHKICWQFLIAVAGSLSVAFDDGDISQEIVLDRDDVGLLLPPLTYGKQFDYSPDAVLLVLASHSYDVADYIDDYQDFLAIKKSI